MHSVSGMKTTLTSIKSIGRDKPEEEHAPPLFFHKGDKKGMQMPRIVGMDLGINERTSIAIFDTYMKKSYSLNEAPNRFIEENVDSHTWCVDPTRLQEDAVLHADSLIFEEYWKRIHRYDPDDCIVVSDETKNTLCETLITEISRNFNARYVHNVYTEPCGLITITMKHTKPKWGFTNKKWPDTCMTCDTDKDAATMLHIMLTYTIMVQRQG